MYLTTLIVTNHLSSLLAVYRATLSVWYYCSARHEIDRYVIYNYLEKTWYYGTLDRQLGMTEHQETDCIHRVQVWMGIYTTMSLVWMTEARTLP